MPADDPVSARSPVTDKRAFTVREVAVMTGFSRDTITRLFEKERGVLIISRPTSNRKRRYRSIRIPVGVYERVIRGISV
ncbi:hypothetical protein HDF16_003810 [Granulicella aggregans]|uniref:Helix-turn-helix domain-containing protein n=1 Tax=Granulicella aggregans TaxID=474949 RepID=A0A7W8E4X7_9BACT|nr:hypothetical protein [Granulicella aggregans]MBB5059087.1 hypothetical protein [Granulicella aggregans]